MKWTELDKITSITLKRQPSGRFTVNLRGYSEGVGYHDKPRQFSGVFLEEFEEALARAIARRENRPTVEAFWNAEAQEVAEVYLQQLREVIK